MGLKLLKDMLYSKSLSAVFGLIHQYVFGGGSTRFGLFSHNTLKGGFNKYNISCIILLYADTINGSFAGWS